jgi:Lrp/AsnC family transcriptional regulator, leucine-responsive regulatory protein
MTSCSSHQQRRFDETDLRILNCLQHHGELSNVELSERVHLSAAQCSRRVQSLQRSGVITGYAALVDRDQLGLGVLAFVSVTFDKAQYKRLGDLHKVVNSFPEVLECHAVTGDCDYLLKVVARDLEAYGVFLNTKLIQAPGVISVRSVVSLNAVKVTTALPLDSR